MTNTDALADINADFDNMIADHARRAMNEQLIIIFAVIGALVPVGIILAFLFI
jgi:hypothetical protein